MNRKEIAEIKKQFTPKNCAATRIAGCYVDAEKNRLATFAESFLPLPDEEIAKYFDIFRKTLSGSLGKNLLNMEFPLESEQEDGTQAFLLRLRDSKLEDDDLLTEFYDRVIDTFVTGENYLILLIRSVYDIPGRTRDELDLDDASEEVYDFFLAAICPVALDKPALSYDPAEQVFHNRLRSWTVGAPQLGFLFPAFNDRQTDIHALLYYSKDPEELHFDLTDRLLGCRLPLSAGLQKEAFRSVVADTLGDACDFEIVKNIHDELREIAEAAKDSPDPVTLTRPQVRSLMEEAGASAAQMEHFDESFTENAGEHEALFASNLQPRRFEVRTPDVVIAVSPERSDLVKTRIIDGRACLVIPITDEVQVNGITVKMPQPEA